MKLSKEDIDFPRYCLFFIKTIQNAIDTNESEEDEPFDVHVETTYPYCSDAFDLIVKTFEKKGFYVMTPTFRLVYKSGIKYYIYRWRFMKDYSDLPF
jgi:hypothetical protein